mmetsp:Transcript_58070/g.155163  ORF Transcript_58070/g.155163 Transcript_58070/m.155163 type:complete len:264 (-) Transcript_58070:987-1778(-)
MLRKIAVGGAIDGYPSGKEISTVMSPPVHLASGMMHPLPPSTTEKPSVKMLSNASNSSACACRFAATVALSSLVRSRSDRWASSLASSSARALASAASFCRCSSSASLRRRSFSAAAAAARAAAASLARCSCASNSRFAFSCSAFSRSSSARRFAASAWGSAFGTFTENSPNKSDTSSWSVTPVPRTFFFGAAGGRPTIWSGMAGGASALACWSKVYATPFTSASCATTSPASSVGPRSFWFFRRRLPRPAGSTALLLSWRGA